MMKKEKYSSGSDKVSSIKELSHIRVLEKTRASNVQINEIRLE